MTDKEKFLELMKEFGIHVDKKEYLGKTHCDLSDDPYCYCIFRFDENGEFSQFMCGE